MTIVDAAKLEAVFGQWPSFHDAEVLRVSLDRSGPVGPALEAVIHVFETTKDVDAEGFLVRRHHTQVTLRFDGIAALRLEGFNGQNVIARLEMTKDPAGLHVTMSSSYGVEADFKCAKATIVDVGPFAPQA